MNGKKMFKLYLKIFAIILFTGMVLPFLIELVLNLIFIVNEKNHSGNSIFVFGYHGKQQMFLEYVIRLLEKIIDFS